MSGEPSIDRLPVISARWLDTLENAGGSRIVPEFSPIKTSPSPHRLFNHG
jgi:hypothetical protein